MTLASAAPSRRPFIHVLVSVVSATALVLAATQGPAVSQTETIQPGDAIANESGGQCTLNWVYDGTGDRAGNVYLGTAAHCVEEVGEQITLQSGTFGSPLFVLGEVAFIAPDLDYAFIEVHDEHTDQVDPAMKGHPQIPAGMSTTQTTGTGDLVQYSGNGVGFHLTMLTRESRNGILHFNDGTEWSALGPVSPGDSGGPVGNLTDGNNALGLVTVLCVGTQCLGSGGVSLEGALQDAASHGFTVELRTV